MCTLSFLPASDGGYLLAHNRDELRSRAAARPPRCQRIGERRILAPEDPEGGGTWIGVDERGRTLAILNGDRPSRLPPLSNPRSRGLLVGELLENAEPGRIEARLRSGDMPFLPFLLVLAAPGTGSHPARLHRWRWHDGRLEADWSESPAIEISSGFEREEVHRRREALFREFLGELPADAAARRSRLLQLHRSHAGGSERGDGYTICMHRPEARTMSCTLVECDARSVRMHHLHDQPCCCVEAQEFELRIE